uniref:Calpain 12 n=1 Tax=Cynoglossus semilaevis TaxID=244447 RepID=A0A3P8WJB3_CYNSE
LSEVKLIPPPLGSIENPIKSKDQDFLSLLEECLKSGQLFSDPTFPAEQGSIGLTGLDPTRPDNEIKWQRPKEISKNAVFVEGTTGTTDICQGQLGNCWLLAALSCLTMHPQLFVKVVPPDQSMSERYAGIFRFRFWQYGEWVEVVVDDRLPVREGRLLFSYSRSRNEFWSALVEKAYAKLTGSYGSLKGGNISEGMEDFTGGIAYSVEISSHTPRVLWRSLTRALSRGSLLSCFIQACSYKEVGQVSGDGLIKGHAYAITDTDMVNNASTEILLLKLRNPWGFIEYQGPWSDKAKEWDAVDKAEQERLELKKMEDGEFWISAEDFSKLFNVVELCNVNPDSLDEVAESSSPSTQAAWSITEHEGAWVPGSSAGGSRRYNKTFWKNPQFQLILKERDLDEVEDSEDDDGTEDDDEVEDETLTMTLEKKQREQKQKQKAKKCTVLVEVLQKDRRRKDKIHFLYIAFHIYKLQGLCLSRNFFMTNRPVGRSGKYQPKRGVWRKLHLDPGNYVILASTYRPNQQGDFFVRIFSKTGNTLGFASALMKFKPIFSAPSLMPACFGLILGLDKDCQLPVETCRQLIFAEDVSFCSCNDPLSSVIHCCRLCQSLFFQFDEDSSGTMSPFELSTALEAAGMKCDGKVIQLLSERFSAGQRNMPFHTFVSCFTRLPMFDAETNEEVKNAGINAVSIQVQIFNDFPLNLVTF